MNAEPCPLGELEMHYRHGDPLLQLLDGHGVQAYGGWGGAIGVLDAMADTLRGSHGGITLTAGDAIRHSAQICTAGRYRALQ
jgi:hypothetical protein